MAGWLAGLLVRWLSGCSPQEQPQDLCLGGLVVLQIDPRLLRINLSLFLAAADARLACGLTACSPRPLSVFSWEVQRN